MAAKETINNIENEVESIVNRWLVDYYYHSFLEMFENDQYEDFCAIRGVVESILIRPVQNTDVMSIKIRVLQFLSRIIEGEKLDLAFDSDQSVTPLESALNILENINQENIISQEAFKDISATLRDMMVGILIKNKEFDLAKVAVNKHFPKTMVGKKAIYMGLIKQKCKTHEIIEKMDFKQFKEKMLAFCRTLCPFSVPFLQKAAKQLVDEKKAKEEDRTVGRVEHVEAGSSSSHLPEKVNVPCKQTLILRTRLEAAYVVLSAGSDEKTFTQLEEEMEREEQNRKESLSLHSPLIPKIGYSQDLEQNSEFQRDSGSPLEASPADEPTQTNPVHQTQAGSLSKTPEGLRKGRQPYTLAQFVIEPDSQRSVQNTACHDIPAESRTEEPQLAPAITRNKRALTKLEELSTDSEEAPPTKLQKKSSSFHKRSCRSKRLPSNSDEDTQESSSPVKRPHKQRAFVPDCTEQESGSEDLITDSLSSSTPRRYPPHSDPETSSTPQKGDPEPSHSKWKELFHNAKESKDTWSDEEGYFKSKKNSGSRDESSQSTSGQRKRMWTESETQQLIEGVKKFGEGNWKNILSYYSFEERTNVQLKDRWRTLKKLKQV